MARASLPFPTPVRFIAFAMALLVIVWMGAGMYVRYVQQVQEERRQRTEDLAAAQIERTRTAFSQIALIERDELEVLRTYRNAAHLERARLLGIGVLQDRAAASVLEENDALVELTSNSYYRVEPLTHSVPFVTRSTAHLLTLLGMRFQAELRRAGLPPYRYVVTSVTRTMEDQRKLRQTNVNAALTSSHFFGTTVDIHYQVFDLPAGNVPVIAPDSLDLDEPLLHKRLHDAYREMAFTRQQKLKAALGRTLLQLQREGKVLVIYERLQPVYHITLGEELTEPAPDATLQPAVTDAAPAPRKTPDEALPEKPGR